MKYMPTDYVDVDTGETVNSLVFKRLSKDNNIKVIRKFKQKLINGKEERFYTTVEYKDGGEVWCGKLFSDEDQVNVHDAPGNGRL